MKLTLRDAENGVEVETSGRQELVVPVFRVRLNVDPADAASIDDKFTLSSDDEPQTYKVTRTVKDDKVPGDRCVDLNFPGVDEKLRYTFEYDPGAQGKKSHVFTGLELSC